MNIDTSKGVYYVIDANTDYKMREILNLARAMANKSYPHLIQSIDFAIMQHDKNTHTIARSNGKISIKDD